MKLPKLLFFTLMTSSLSTVWASDEICTSVHGKHQLFHHIKDSAAPGGFSEPKLLEIEINRDGTLISSYHFDDKYVETAIFSQTFPQLTYFSQKHEWERGCISREPECEQLRDDVRSYNLNLIYLDIENLDQATPNPQVAKHRAKVLACANTLRARIIASN